MKLSKLNKAKLYYSINKPILECRAKMQMSKGSIEQVHIDILDEMMFNLEQDIWREVSKSLKLDAHSK